MGAVLGLACGLRLWRMAAVATVFVLLLVVVARIEQMLTKNGARSRRMNHGHINFNPFKLACPFLPTMMWSCTAIPNGAAIATIALVTRMSACEGVGSPEGWLCIPNGENALRSLY